MPITTRDLFHMLRNAVYYEVVTYTEGTDHLLIEGRISPRTRANEALYSEFINYMLVAEKSWPWHVDLSTHFFLKGPSSKQSVHSKRIILKHTNVAEHYSDFLNVIKNFRPAQRRVLDITEMEIPLAGAGDYSTAGGRRGAGPTGTVPVGPMAVLMKMQGG